MPAPGSFHCPGDGSVGGTATSYFYNSGVSRAWGAVWNGPFQGVAPGLSEGRKFRPGQIRDGLSQTAAFAEALFGGSGRSRTVATTRMRHPVGLEGTLAFLDECRSLPAPDPFGGPFRRGHWVQCARGDSSYSHTDGPNARACTNGGDIGTGSWPADSDHRGVVNVALLDGSSRAVSESIDLNVWRSVGTPNGGEAMASSF